MEPVEKQPEDNWIKSYWRPAMAWQYLVVCLFDFLFFPLITGWYSWFVKIPYEVWKPITMSEGGFYHVAMGAIIGVTAWTRGREKVAEIESYKDMSSETERRIKAARRSRVNREEEE